jgi:hypothetical protein
MRALDKMRDNMMWFSNVGEVMLKKCQEAHEAGDNPVAVDFMDMHVKMRMASQKCAEAIAPYEDPKLSATVPAPEDPGDDKDAVIDNATGDRLDHITARFQSRLRTVGAS